ncbi:hypothetical protein NL523_28975, partial [Klebsiella pneumoniae]|nr:hypothetical protein [Klebsiella pneumoniae]MCP6663783.1 hypothetical protein [Klebsiella pneumoniae]
ELAETIDPTAIAKLGERVFKLLLRRQSLVPYVTAGITWTLQQGKDREIYGAIVDKLTVLVRQPETRDAIYRYLEQIIDKT